MIFFNKSDKYVCIVYNSKGGENDICTLSQELLEEFLANELMTYENDLIQEIVDKLNNGEEVSYGSNIYKLSTKEEIKRAESYYIRDCEEIDAYPLPDYETLKRKVLEFRLLHNSLK